MQSYVQGLPAAPWYSCTACIVPCILAVYKHSWKRTGSSAHRHLDSANRLASRSDIEEHDWV